MVDHPEEIRGMIDKRYQIKYRLGYGLYANVYQADDTRNSNSPIVVKIMRMEKEDFDGRILAFEHEKNILRDLKDFADKNKENNNIAMQYRCIVKYITSGVHRERLSDRIVDLPYIVFEPLSEKSICIHNIVGERVFERGSLGIMLADEVIDVLIGCCDALSLAHAQRISYWDLKPEHVFWDREIGQVTLIDWNFAIEDDNTERLRLRDLFRLGALAYYMLTGIRPSSTITPLWNRRSLISNNHRHIPLTYRDGIPDTINFGVYQHVVPSELRKLVLHLLDKEPDRRPSYISDIRNELVNIRRIRSTQNVNLLEYKQIRSSQIIKDVIKEIIENRRIGDRKTDFENLIKEAIDENPDDHFAKELLFWIKLAKRNLMVQKG